MTFPVQIRRALLSVSDKSHLLPLVQFLAQQGIAMLSTGGTAQYIRENGYLVTDVEEATGFPEILSGRVKTLHPHIHAGILFQRNSERDQETLLNLHIQAIDLVVVNLYPFSTMAQNTNATESDLIEHIDIGGPTMLRAAAKNYPFVCVLSNPEQYEHFIEHYQTNRGTTFDFRKTLAQRVFSHTAQYDAHIANTLQNTFNEQDAPSALAITATKVQNLRYGENPHQKASVYQAEHKNACLDLATTKPLQGKALSYNNLLDAQAAILSLRCLMERTYQTSLPGAVYVKHNIPCGAAFAKDLLHAAQKGFASDPTSAFGGVVGLSGLVDQDTALFLCEHFFEVIIAPEFSTEAQTLFSKKPNLRLIALPHLFDLPLPEVSIRSIFGGFLLQTLDRCIFAKDRMTVVTELKPSEEDWHALEMSYRMAIHVPSNAIAIANKTQLVGVGGGQPNRVGAVHLAIRNALQLGHALHEAALASDAFFPFADSVEAAHEAGIRAIIQPGGGIHEQEIIKKANELDLVMVFSHERHFRH